MKRVARAAVPVVCIAAMLVPVSEAAGARGETLFLSRASGADGAAGDAGSYIPAISGHGRIVAFTSSAQNLSDEDGNSVAEVYARDVATATTTLVSRANGAAGASADANAYDASVSADGRFIAFYSGANNLSGEDNDAYDNVFVRDLRNNTTTLVSRADGAGGAGADGASYSPSISADGRFVAFHSGADNLSAEDDNGFENVFVRDVQTGATILVSRANGAAGAAGDSSSGLPSISADGRFVAFYSLANNLSGDDADAVIDIFVRDLQTGTTTFASRADGTAGAGANNSSGEPAISADGRFVAFHSAATNLPDDADGANDIFVRDLQAGTTRLASRADGPTGASADAFASDVSISADGRYVAFESAADNLSEFDDNAQTNMFVRDLQGGSTIFASRANGVNGAPADYDSDTYGNAMSADGRFVVFSSYADNLSTEDDNTPENVYRRDVLGPRPACANLVQLVAANAPTTLTLPCADEDGDAMTRAIAGGPAHGTLGAIDQSTGAVTYTPVPGYSGPDSFTFHAADATGAGNTAMASLTVGAAGAAGPGGTTAAGLLPGRCANVLRGTNRADVVNGTPAGDRISGRRGNDVLRGFAGADCLSGGRGRDGLSGGRGNDSLGGGPGRDRMRGGSGRDRLTDRRGRDRFSGGPGNDRINARDLRRRDRRRRDRITCGGGTRDVVFADRRDGVGRSCERVRRR